MRNDTNTPTISLIGLGYVGLPTALCLLGTGVRVIGYDVSSQRIAAIRLGDVDLIPADHERLASSGSSPLFAMTTEPARLREADAIIICVPTPVDEHNVPDLRAISGACRTAVAQARSGQVIILTSTTYIGCTADLLVKPLTERGFTVGEDIFVAYAPERIDPGNTSNVQENVPRVVGGYTHACAIKASEVIGMVAPLVHTVDSLEEAEMAKMLENTFRAVNIALVNEFSEVAAALGVDITNVIKAAATKPFGFMPFWPGPGVGGHCIACDPHYLLWQLGTGVTAPIVQASMNAITRRPSVITRCVCETLADNGKPVNGAKICVVGVAFKPNVADVRETPARNIIAQLIGMGASISYYDPLVSNFRVGDRTINQAEANAKLYDLVVVLNRHDGHDYSWLAHDTLIVDASYRMDSGKTRILP